MPRPSHCTVGRWRSTRRRTAPTTPTSPHLNNLAWLLRTTNRLAEAEPLLRRVLEILLKFIFATRSEHPYFRQATNSYTGLLAAMGLSKAQIERAQRDRPAVRHVAGGRGDTRK